MKIFKLLCVTFLIISFMACDNDTDPKDATLENNIWKMIPVQDANCDLYFQFNSSDGLLMNPCYESDTTIIDLIYWMKFNYTITDSQVNISLTDGCNPSLISSNMNYLFSITSDTLTLTINSTDYTFTKENNLPILNENIEYGYWDKGSWITSTCSKPY